jgi:hypothetical protein
MGFIDLIRELRTGEPDLKKAAKTMKFLGWGCLLGGLWNFILPQVVSFKETGFHLPAYFPYFALIAFSIIGGLFLLSARGIQEMEPWGNGDIHQIKPPQCPVKHPIQRFWNEEDCAGCE